MKGKALRRALVTSDAVRINAPVPLMPGRVVLFTPESAQEMLQKNKHNRPVNWNQVEKYSDIMACGEWKLTPQGIILDADGNIITGQTRLWAVVYSGASVYMYVTYGCSSEIAVAIDRGRPQSARDLATRKTDKKHSPVEQSLARAICIMRGNSRPSTDDVAKVIVDKAGALDIAVKEARRDKKSKALLMVMAAICESHKTIEDVTRTARRAASYADKLAAVLAPHTAEECWGKGTAFSMALEQARKIVS